MHYKIQGSGAKVTLGKDQFVAKGGEGSIYIIGDTIYKVCEPGKMIDVRKIAELTVLNHPRIITPEDVILDNRDKPTGYTMRSVPKKAKTLAEILTKTYRERESVTPDMMRALVEQIADGIRYIHTKKNYLQVDGNQLNYMVTADHKDAYFIDVNSFKTPNFPPDAIMPNIRDWNAGTNFNHGTDWYSFAIVSFYMFTGIHPFMHVHPRFPNRKTSMIDQMKAGVSILDKDAGFPMAAVYFPFDLVIPANYFDWYRKVFVDNLRILPPGQAHVAFVFLFKEQQLSGTNNFEINLQHSYKGQIVGFLASKGREITVTSADLYVDNQPKGRPEHKFRVGFTPQSNTPVLMTLNDEEAEIRSLDSGNMLSLGTINANDIMACEGRLYTHSGQHIYEVAFMENGSNTLAATKHVATVLPHATKLYQGVALQDMFGTTIASIFPESGHHRQVRLPEITASMRVIEAKYERNVLMIVVMDNETGQHSRLVFRFEPHFVGYDLRRIENITPVGLNFTVLERGICICVTEDAKVEIFTNKANDPNVKEISDPAVKGDMYVCHSGDQARLAHGEKLYSFAVKRVQ